MAGLYKYTYVAFCRLCGWRRYCGPVVTTASRAADNHLHPEYVVIRVENRSPMDAEVLA